MHGSSRGPGLFSLSAMQRNGRRLIRAGLAAAMGLLAACSSPAQPAPEVVPAPVPVAPAPVLSTAPAAPVRVAPTRPPAQLWPFTKLAGADYVSLEAVAERYGMKLAWAKPDLERTLADARGIRFRFEVRQRDSYLDGVRVFLGAPVMLHKGELWISKLDVIKTVAPLLRPEDHRVLLPDTPPRLIVLDAGHGGADPGKQNLRLKLNEKDLTLDVVLRLKKILELRGYAVRLTRSEDVKLAPEQRADLERRAGVANEAKADLFLSIHFNAVEPKDAARVTGTETYVLTPQFQLSSTDNTGDSLTGIAFPGNKQDTANVVLGYHLHRQMLSGLKSSDRGFKRGRLRVLCFPECPAALLEAAYLSNDKEAARLGTPEFRQEIAEAIAEGVAAYSATLAGLRNAPPQVN
jgi:N-acetylmuramoyl-L-alanine amidase